MWNWIAQKLENIELWNHAYESIDSICNDKRAQVNKFKGDSWVLGISMGDIGLNKIFSDSPTMVDNEDYDKNKQQNLAWQNHIMHPYKTQKPAKPS